MEKFWTVFASILLWTLFVFVAFTVTVLIASAVNQVAFYDQLCLWFGHESGFARIFLG